MKKLLLNLILFAVISLPNVMAQTTTKSSEVLTNSRIQELNSKGLSSSIIVSKINESSCAFDVSTDELIRLKEKKVPDEVVYAMIESMKSPKEEEANPNKPAYSQGSGIYYHSLGDDHEQMIYLEPSVSGQSSTGSGIGSRLSFGAASTKMKSSVPQAASHLQIENTEPEFYFYFDSNTNNIGNSSSGNLQATSPNEFVLIKFIVKGKNREFITGSINNWSGANFGIDEAQRIEFSFERIRPGVYKVTPVKTLMPGEYAFLPAGGATAGTYGGFKLYDFGVK